MKHMSYREATETGSTSYTIAQYRATPYKLLTTDPANYSAWSYSVQSACCRALLPTNCSLQCYPYNRLSCYARTVRCASRST
eukprot:3117615-Rhodomonas_salina.1